MQSFAGFSFWVTALGLWNLPEKLNFQIKQSFNEIYNWNSIMASNFLCFAD